MYKQYFILKEKGNVWKDLGSTPVQPSQALVWGFSPPLWAGSVRRTGGGVCFPGYPQTTPLKNTEVGFSSQFTVSWHTHGLGGGRPLFVRPEFCP